MPSIAWKHNSNELKHGKRVNLEGSAGKAYLKISDSTLVSFFPIDIFCMFYLLLIMIFIYRRMLVFMNW